MVSLYSSPSVDVMVGMRSQDQAHVSLSELDFIFFNRLDLDWENAVVSGQLLVFPSLFSDVPLLRADVIKTIVEIPIPILAILAQKVMQVALCVVVGCRQVLSKKDLDRERL